jgi:protein tyrosine/serine phosphatase
MKMRIIFVFTWVFLSIGIAWANASSSKRASTSAQPIHLEGVSNLYKISDDLYRSGQPSAAGLRNLEAMGIKTILNLRCFHWDRFFTSGEPDCKYEHIYFKAWHPEVKDVVRFLRIVTDHSRTPVLVHCHRGSERAGTMVAVYRIAVQGWSKEEAIREMTEGGFGFNDSWSNLPRWVQELDINSIKEKAGLITAAGKAD